MAIILHKNIIEDELHAPKGYNLPSTNSMSYALRSEGDVAIYQDVEYLPGAINFVDGNNPPPTTATDDIYVIIDGGGGVVDPGWGAIPFNSWNRYDSSNWNSVSAVDGFQCYDKTAKEYKFFNGTVWASAGGGSTNLTEGATTTTTVQLDSSTGSSATLQQATTLRAGLMSSAIFDAVALNTLKTSGATEVGTGVDSLKQSGVTATASGNNSLALLKSSNAAGTGAIAIGHLASVNDAGSVSIGQSATSVSTDGGVTVGLLANNSGAQAVSLGYLAINTGAASGSVTIGRETISSASNTVCIGQKMRASAPNAIIIGGSFGFRTNSTANSVEFNFNEVNSSIRLARDTDSFLDSTGGFGFGVKVPLAKVHIKGLGSTYGGLASFLVTNSTPAATFLVRGDGTLNAVNLQVYVDDTAAGVGGLVVGDFYQTATGELRIKL